MSDSLWPHGLYPARLLCSWNSPGKNTGVGRCFLQGVFPTQGSNPRLLHCKRILCHWTTREAATLMLYHFKKAGKANIREIKKFWHPGMSEALSKSVTEPRAKKCSFYIFPFLSPHPPHLKKYIFVFNWRIITLQYCVDFCHTSTWIKHRYTCVPSLLNLSPTFHPIPPL